MARKSAAERRAAAPAFAQMMHALCAAGQPGEALEVGGAVQLLNVQLLNVQLLNAVGPIALDSARFQPLRL